MNAIFLNRREAGSKLAEKLTFYQNHPQAIVLGLPRGGVPVAYEIARHLNLPLDVCLVKKLSLPDNPEIAIGAICLQHGLTETSNTLVLNNGDHTITIDENITHNHDLMPESIERIANRVTEKLNLRERCYRHHRQMLNVKDSIVIVVDDGIATGLTMLAAVKALGKQQPQEIIVATPVASWQAMEELAPTVDNIICLHVPESLNAVGNWYEDFSQVPDREVCELLSQETRGLVGSG